MLHYHLRLTNNKIGDLDTSPTENMVNFESCKFVQEISDLTNL